MLCNQSSRFYCDEQDVEGVLKLLADEEKERDSDFDSALCQGASITFASNKMRPSTESRMRSRPRAVPSAIRYESSCT